MSDNEKLQSMLDNLINQKSEQAQVDFHDYLQDKMQNVINPGQAENKKESDKE